MQASADSRAKPSILFLLSSLTVGGSERKAVNLANTLSAQGFAVTLAYLNDPEFLLGAINPEIKTALLGRRGKFSLGALRSLAQLVRNGEIKVVVSVNLYPALYAVLMRNLFGMRSVRVVTSVNTTEFGTRKEQIQMILYRWVLRCVDHILFGARKQQELWCARYGLRTEQTTVLYNGVDTNRFDPERVARVNGDELPRGSLIVGTVGKLRPEKAHVHLVRALEKLRARGLDVGLLIVGDGPERPNVEAEARRLKLSDNIRITGEIKDVRPWLAAMEVFVLSSVAVETFSNAALEAMAMGVPVVSSRTGGMDEMLVFGGGRLYTSGDMDELFAELAHLLSDHAFRRDLGAQGRRVAIQQFSWNRMVDNFIASVVN